MSEHYVNSWHRVWSNRPPISSEVGNVLGQLIAMEGFDTPLGAMNESEWLEYVAIFARRAGIRKADSVCEIGCGAFLYPFYEAGQSVTGWEYSRELIEIARTVMPRRAEFFFAGDAGSVAAFPLEDAVIANHVVHYFPTHDYAGLVLKKMLSKAARVVGIARIPDAGLARESEMARRGLLSKEVYDRKYSGLEILYYRKDWFSELGNAAGFDAQFFAHDMPGFAQNAYRFDCVLTRA